MPKLIISSGFIVVLIVISVFSLNFYRLSHHAMTSKAVVISLDKNTSTSSFVHDLESKHLIQSSRFFLWSIRLQGLSSRLKAGIYEIKPYETAQQFLIRVVKGDVLILPFRIIEGSTLHAITTQLMALPYVSKDSIDWSKIDENHGSAEGLLLADTYHYSAGSTGLSLLLNAHSALLRFLNEAWAHRAADLPYKNPYEMLIASSIIEKEASKPEEKRLVSGVIVNRLKKRMPLQMDPTIIYALGTAFQGKLNHVDLAIDSPYNTYKHYGLPPTPIAMVGKDSIDAAAHPTTTSYLYYVSRGDGTHQFSETYEQQKKAIVKLNQK